MARLIKLFAMAALFEIALVTLMQPALAQSTPEPKPEAPKIRVLPPAYDPQMMRLSEILGALHYLRELCEANEGQLWRDQMSTLIEQEKPTEERRAQMIARFNQGFRGFQETYRECTPAAIEANNRYVAEGKKLSNEVPSRYGR
ncbi:MAG: TIGR02301 family protein [Pseudomonadota bacterium]